MGDVISALNFFLVWCFRVTCRQLSFLFPESGDQHWSWHLQIPLSHLALFLFKEKSLKIPSFHPLYPDVFWLLCLATLGPLELGPPVLEPDLDLALPQLQAVGQPLPPGLGQVRVRVELRGQPGQLFPAEGGPRTLQVALLVRFALGVARLAFSLITLSGTCRNIFQKNEWDLVKEASNYQSSLQIFDF